MTQLFLSALLALNVVEGLALPAKAQGDGSPPGPLPRAGGGVIVAFGDSLTAGYGVKRAESWPALLQKRLDRGGYRFKVVNAGVSGETSSGGLRRVDAVLAHKPVIVILGLGANDGLRGQPASLLRDNLSAIITKLQGGGARVLLAGMKLPANYGPEYTTAFEAVYPELAEKHGVDLIPFLLEGAAFNPLLVLDDGLHPNAAGYKKVAGNVWRSLKPMLSSSSAPLPRR